MSPPHPENKALLRDFLPTIIRWYGLISWEGWHRGVPLDFHDDMQVFKHAKAAPNIQTLHRHLQKPDELLKTTGKTILEYSLEII